MKFKFLFIPFSQFLENVIVFFGLRHFIIGTTKCYGAVILINTNSLKGGEEKKHQGMTLLGNEDIKGMVTILSHLCGSITSLQLEGIRSFSVYGKKENDF